MRYCGAGVPRPPRRAVIVWCLLAVCLLASCTGRPRPSGTNEGKPSLFGAFPKQAGKLLAIDLSAGVPESLEGGLFPAPPERTYPGLVKVLEEASTDERLSGLIVLFGATSVGWSRAEEIGRMLALSRQREVPVVCHAHQLSNAALWLAAVGCDSIWLSPAGGVDAVGIAAQVLYFRTALDHLKLKADFIAVGKFKSAVESFTRDGPTDAARQDLEETLGSLRRSWLDGTSSARQGAKVRESLEQGPWTPKEALARGLIDAVGYESDALDDAKKRSEAERAKPVFGPRAKEGELDIGELVRVLSGVDERSSGRPRIALVPAVGAIAMSSGGGLVESGGISARSLSKTIRRLREDDGVKAVVLRIDSPGGSALASDLLWNDLRRLGKEKPLVVSVGDMAASGGYYMAAAAQEIVAERSSIVGSIGVFGGKITADEGISALGVNAVTFPASDAPGAGARAAYLSPFVAWDDPTRARVKAGMQAVYDLFVHRVAEGRGLPVERVKELARGRIYTGVQGKKRGLVDALGGLQLAVDRVRELAELDDDVPVVVEGTGESLLEMLTLAENASQAEVEAAVARWRIQQLRLADLVPARLRPFVSSLNPLLQGERTLTAVPYAVWIE